MKEKSVGIAILTLNAEKHLPFCLPPLLASSLKPTVMILDSSSTDNTVPLAQSMGAKTLIIDRKDFNHGETRELARKTLGTDIVVMITADAYANTESINQLVTPILEGKAAAAYGRQIPHKGAAFFEAFPRDFNYPSTSHIRTAEDIQTYGTSAFFCSDSFAAYSNCALDKIGGFQRVLLGEDTLAVAQLLRSGYQVAYVAEAVVSHSHRYSLWEEFRRYFDTGLARVMYGHAFKCEKNDSERGKQYVKALLSTLIKQKPHLLPYGIMHVLVKWLGYKIGQKSNNAPLWFKKVVSSQNFYWSSNPYLKNK